MCIQNSRENILILIFHRRLCGCILCCYPRKIQKYLLEWRVWLIAEFITWVTASHGPATITTFRWTYNPEQRLNGVVVSAMAINTPLLQQHLRSNYIYIFYITSSRCWYKSDNNNSRRYTAGKTQMTDVRVYINAYV